MLCKLEGQTLGQPLNLAIGQLLFLFYPQPLGIGVPSVQWVPNFTHRENVLLVLQVPMACLNLSPSVTSLPQL